MPAPIGNTNAANGVRWRNAIDSALKNRCKSDGQKALVKIAEAMLLKAEEGDMTAIKELGDRIDGKVAQTTVLEGGDKPVQIEATARPAVSKDEWLKLHKTG